MAGTLTLNKQQAKAQTPPQTLAAPAAIAPEQQAQRQARQRTFSASSLTPLGYGRTEIMTIDVPPEWTFADVLRPLAWSSVVGPIAANAAKTQVDRIGSLIYVNTLDNRFMAWLRITAIERDELKNPVGVKTQCVGPCLDPKTGRPCPLDLKTGLAWVDPEPAEAASTAAA